MAANSSDNKFSISWHDSAWIPILNADNVLDYFCQRSNTFYDKTCNNEHVKMQRLDPGQLQYMTGVEYELIHAQDPILYVIKKQMRHSPNQVTALAFYYVLAGVVYQAPDVGSLINSRLLSTVCKLQSAFAEAQSYSRYSPSKGYWWQFKDAPADASKKEKKANKALEASSVFQRQRVDLLLAGFAQKFPPKTVQPRQATGGEADGITNGENGGAGKMQVDETSLKNSMKVESPEQVPIAQMIAASAESNTTNKPFAPVAKKKKE